MARDIKKISERSLRLIALMDRKRGTQTKLAKSIGKTTSFFSEIKRGKPVNVDHLTAVGLVFGPQVALELLALDTIKSHQEEKEEGTVSGYPVECIGIDIHKLKRRVDKLEKENKDLRALLDEHQKASSHFEASKK